MYEVNVVTIKGKIYAVCGFVASRRALHSPSFPPDFVLNFPFSLKNRLIPLWHAICGWVIDLDFFYGVVVVFLQGTFHNFILPPLRSHQKQFSNKLFTSPPSSSWKKQYFFQIVSHPNRVPKFYLRIASFSFLSLFSCFLHRT